MIVRLWHGRTNISEADEYAEFMKERAAPDYGSIDGLKNLYFTSTNRRRCCTFLVDYHVGFDGVSKEVCRGASRDCEVLPRR